MNIKMAAVSICASVLIAACGGEGTHSENGIPSGEDRAQEETFIDRVTDQNYKSSLANEASAFFEYSLQDFDFENDIDHLEIRLACETGDDLVFRPSDFGLATFNSLSDSQQQRIEDTVSSSGFLPQCGLSLYGACSVYLVSWKDGTEIIASLEALRDLMGTIDSDAELALWMYANDFNVHSFEAKEDGNGYWVIADIPDEDRCCSDSEEGLLNVDSVGNIVIEKTFFSDDPQFCI